MRTIDFLLVAFLSAFQIEPTHVGSRNYRSVDGYFNLLLSDDSHYFYVQSPNISYGIWEDKGEYFLLNSRSIYFSDTSKMDETRAMAGFLQFKNFRIWKIDEDSLTLNLGTNRDFLLVKSESISERIEGLRSAFYK